MKNNDISKLQVHNKHHQQKSGKKIKNQKEKNIELNKPRGTNMKAYAVQNVKNVRYNFQKRAQIEFTAAKLPLNIRQGMVPPPDMVAIIGPHGVGKTTLLKALVKSYTGKSITTPCGPVTVSVSNSKRIQLFDVPNDLTAVIDIARVVELAIIVIDSSIPLQTDLFEYLNVFQALGFPKIFTVLTHQDKIEKQYFKTRKLLRQRIEREVSNGCKIFDMPFIACKQVYKKDKIDVLARCIAQQKYSQPLEWRSQHGCVLVDRIEPHDNGKLACFGFVRGAFIAKGQDFTIPGMSDVDLSSIEQVPDPALPDQKLVLNKNKPVLYAPLSEIGDIKVDNEAIRVRLGEKDKKGKAHEAAQIIQSIQIGQSNEINLLDGDNENILAKENSVSQENKDIPNDEINSTDKELLNINENFEEEEEEELELSKNSNTDNEEQEPQDNNDWLGVNAEDNEQHKDDCMSESTDQNLDVEHEELEKQALENNEEVDEGEEQNENEQQEQQCNMQQYLSKLKLVKPGASKQYYHDLIYTYYKKKNVIKQAKSSQKSSLMKLFDDEEEENKNLTDVTLLPPKMKKNYTQLPFQLRDSSRVYPINSQLLHNEISMPKQLDFSNLQKYFIQDSNFAEAVHKCLDQSNLDQIKKEEQDEKKTEAEMKEQDANLDKMCKNKNRNVDDSDQTQQDKKFVNPLTNIKIDDKFLTQKEKDVIHAKERERLLDPQLEQQSLRFPPGTYVRFEFIAPPEFQKNYNKHHPLILGSLLPQENQKQFITAKVKRHRWFPKILKTRNPMVFAVGWRRFQVLPFYSMQQEGKTLQNVDTALQMESPPMKLLKYTPEHMHCWCTFYGYRVPAGSGIIAFQDVGSKDFRVCLNGIVQESSFEVKVYKKLKLVGYCDQLFNRSAVVSQMFTTRLEAAAFLGAKVRTVSGIRGIVKHVEGDDGKVRISFEDRVKNNDIVFMKTYVKCKIDKFYNEWDNHLGQFQQLRQMAQIRQDKNIPIEYKSDSVYKAEKRPVFVKQDLKLNQNLVRKLPFQQAKQYQNEVQQRTQQDEITYKKNQIKDKDLRQLVHGGKQEEHESIIKDFQMLNDDTKKEKEQKQKIQEYAKQQWDKGMNKRHDELVKEKMQERRKNRRVALEIIQKKELKKQQLK